MRHGGFVQASRVLGLTASAVSHRIRELERVLGCALFDRRNRSAIPTLAARRYFDALQDGFERMEAATRTVSDASRAEVLSIHCAPSFAAQWLMPRLKRFIAAHPEYIVRLSSTPDSAQFADESFDIDIQYARPVPAGMESLVLAEESIVPLCAPDYRTACGEPLTLATLKDVTLLHSVRNVVQWPDWFQKYAPGVALPIRAMQFDRSFMAIGAASDGLGLCLESTLIAQEEIRNGRLILPFGQRSLAAAGHRLVWRPGALNLSRVSAIRGWLLDELGHEAGASTPHLRGPNPNSPK